MREAFRKIESDTFLDNISTFSFIFINYEFTIPYPNLN